MASFKAVNGKRKPNEYESESPNDAKCLPLDKTYTVFLLVHCDHFKILKTKCNMLYIRNQFVPRSKHFPPQL